VKKLNLSEANEFLAQLLKSPPIRKPEEKAAVLMKGRKPVAVIVPVGDADLETVSLSFSPKFHEIMERSRRSAVTEGSFTHEEICREFGLPLPGESRAKNNSRVTKPKNPKTLVKSSRARARS
jgi:hypothetical protein